MEDRVLVLGGGISGITCALELSACGINVTILEKKPSIGGKMIMLDKTFPTLDCSSCILTPKMAEVSMRRNIELLTLCRVEDIKRKNNFFSTKILSMPRYVDINRCSACGLCAQACAMYGKVKDEFNCNLSTRPAIYIPFPQAHPQKYLIDKNACLFLSKGKCKKKCVEVCKNRAINFEEKEKILEADFSAIVLATGFDIFDASLIDEFGYGRIEGVLTSLEFERILSATGPTDGEIIFGGKKPKRFFFIHCVGSRDFHRGVKYCSRVCCMYTAKHAYIVREKIKDARIYVSYIDVRAFGKGYEEFFRLVQEQKVIYIKGLPGEITKTDDCLIVRVEDSLSGQLREIEVDLVILACAIVPSREIYELKEILGLELDEYGFVKVDPTRPSNTNVEGIFVCGVASGPKDIPESVAQSTEAAASVIEYLSKK